MEPTYPFYSLVKRQLIRLGSRMIDMPITYRVPQNLPFTTAAYKSLQLSVCIGDPSSKLKI